MVLGTASGCRAKPVPSLENSASSAVADVTKFAVKVTKDGFEPSEVKLTVGKPAALEFTRAVESECLNAVRMPWLTEPVALPLGKPIVIPVDTKTAGSFRYSCWMGMVFGKVTVAPN